MSRSSDRTAAEEPVIAQKGPYKVELLGGYRYAWCACGCQQVAAVLRRLAYRLEDGHQAQGVHAGQGPDGLPLRLQAVAKFPFCDGTHNKL